MAAPRQEPERSRRLLGRSSRSTALHQDQQVTRLRPPPSGATSGREVRLDHAKIRVTPAQQRALWHLSAPREIADTVGQICTIAMTEDLRPNRAGGDEHKVSSTKMCLGDQWARSGVRARLADDMRLRPQPNTTFVGLLMATGAFGES